MGNTLFWARQPVRHTFDRARGPLRRLPCADPRVVSFRYDGEPCDAVVDFVLARLPGYPSPDHLKTTFDYLSLFIVEAQLRGVLLAHAAHLTLRGTLHRALLYDHLLGEPHPLFAAHEARRAGPSVFRSDPLPGVVPLVDHPVWWAKTLRARRYRIPLARALDLHAFLAAHPFPCTLLPVAEKTKVAYFAFHRGAPTSLFVFDQTFELYQNQPILDCVAVVTAHPGHARRAFSTIVHNSRAVFPIVRIHGRAHAQPFLPPFQTTHHHYYTYGYATEHFAPADTLLF